MKDTRELDGMRSEMKDRIDERKENRERGGEERRQ